MLYLVGYFFGNENLKNLLIRIFEEKKTFILCLAFASILTVYVVFARWFDFSSFPHISYTPIKKNQTFTDWTKKDNTLITVHKIKYSPKKKEKSKEIIIQTLFKLFAKLTIIWWYF